MNQESGDPRKPAPVGLKAQIDLPGPVAIWVLGAHTIALLTPLLLLWAVYANWEFVFARTIAPAFFYVAVALMMASAAFEIAQNTADRWYLTVGMGSTTRAALADFLFYMCNALSMLALITACIGGFWWLLGLCALVAGVFAFLYLTGRQPFMAFGVLGAGSILSLYFAFNNPILFLQLVTGQLTLVLLHPAAEDPRPISTRLRGSGQHLGPMGL